MTIYKNIRIDNIRKKKNKEKRKENKYFWRCVLVLDNCKSFGVFNIFKSMFKNGYIFFIC